MIRVLVTDDEETARDRLRQMLGAIPDAVGPGAELLPGNVLGVQRRNAGRLNVAGVDVPEPR